MKILVFGEGDAEENVCNGLKKLTFSEFKYLSAKGNTRSVNKTLINTISPLLQEEEPISCVILYDLDSHENKTEKSILDSILGESGLQKIERFRTINFRHFITQDSNYSNLHTLSIPETNFRLAIHIANKRWKQNFEKSAIDDYVLELALMPKTVTNLLAEINKAKTKINIPSSKIFDKITKEIPDLLKANANGKDDLVEAKDYVRLYAAVLKLHTSPAVFAAKVMGNADEQDIREVFGALLKALKFVGGM